MGTGSLRLVRLRAEHVHAANRAADLLTWDSARHLGPRERGQLAAWLRRIAEAYEDGFPAHYDRSPAVQFDADQPVRTEPSQLDRAGGTISSPGSTEVAARAARRRSSPSLAALAFEIGELDVSDRVHRALAAMGARTLADVARLKPSQLLARPGFGRQSLVRLSAAMADFGLSLAPEKPSARSATPQRRT